MFLFPVHTDFFLIWNPAVLNSLWNQGEANNIFESQPWWTLCWGFYTYYPISFLQNRSFSPCKAFALLLFLLYKWFCLFNLLALLLNVKYLGSILCPVFSSLGLAGGLIQPFGLLSISMLLTPTFLSLGPTVRLRSRLMQPAWTSPRKAASPPFISPSFYLPFSLSELHAVPWTCQRILTLEYLHLLLPLPGKGSPWYSLGCFIPHQGSSSAHNI